ncbi:MAG: flagellar export protein FliJ [Nevskia sp.]|nr:flagellar export protein FliJ [Nevskia sp.]
MNAKTSLSQRLDPVRRIAQDREDEAAKRFAESQRVLAQREAQLREMERYLQEYGGSASGAAAVPTLMSNRDAFLRQLAEALRWQAGAVVEARARFEAARDQWLRKRCDTNVLDRLIERGETAEQRSAERKVQRELDEFALRQRFSSQPG